MTIERDLTALTLQTSERFSAAMTPVDERSPAQNEAASTGDTLITELEASDILVIGSPIYNFGLPSSVKAWMDYVARAGRTFHYAENGPVGLLTGKRAFITMASGGVGLGTDWDFGSGHLSLFLGFLGFSDITVIAAMELQSNPENLAAAEAQIREIAES